MSVLIGELPNLSIKFMLSAYLLNVFHHYCLVLLVEEKKPQWSTPLITANAVISFDINITFTFMHPIDC